MGGGDSQALRPVRQHRRDPRRAAPGPGCDPTRVHGMAQLHMPYRTPRQEAPAQPLRHPAPQTSVEHRHLGRKPPTRCTPHGAGSLRGRRPTRQPRGRSTPANCAPAPPGAPPAVYTHPVPNDGRRGSGMGCMVLSPAGRLQSPDHGHPPHAYPAHGRPQPRQDSRRH